MMSEMNQFWINVLWFLIVFASVTWIALFLEIKHSFVNIKKILQEMWWVFLILLIATGLVIFMLDFLGGI